MSLRFPRDRESLRAELDAAAARGGAQPIVVAWSFYSASFPDAAEELRWLRAERPGVRFLALAGGVHATAEPEQTLDAGFDLVCVGEGERALIGLCERLARGEPPAGAPGFASRSGARVVRVPSPPPGPLEAFAPFAVRHHKYGPVEITRGCIYACRFCQTPFLNKARFRHRPVEDVARWVRALREAGKRDVRFITPTSLSYGAAGTEVELGAVEALLRRAREEAGPQGRLYFGTFPSELRPEHVTPEAMALLRRHVDNDNVIIGGQSGSERVLAETRRGHDAECIVRAARLAVEAGFIANVDFIVGLPGEAPEDVQATVQLMRRVADAGGRVHAHTFMPLPGTPYRDAPAGSVAAQTRAELERLASRGRLYGQWKRQQELADHLTARRSVRS